MKRQDPSPDGGATLGPITKFQYDLDGNLVAVIDARGDETQYVYNDRNQRVEEIDPAPGGTISYSYNAALELVQVVDAAGHVTQYQYNADGQRTATIAPNLTTGLAGDASTTTTDGYDLAGNLVIETAPNGATTTNQYDLLNQLVKTTQPVPGTGGAAPVTSYGYDPAGELTTTTNAIGLTQTDTFDGLGRVTDEVGFNGVTTSNSYNILSQLVTTEQQGGGITANQTTNAYDALGRLVSTTEVNIPGHDDLTQFGYDLLGNRTSLTDGDGNVTRWQFDALNRPIAERLPTGALETYQYDADGNLLKSVDGDGHIIQYAYNALNEPTSETWQTMPAVVSAPPETIQAIVMEHGATGGDWTLAFNGGAPQSIAYNAAAGDVQAALENITALKGNVEVTGSGTPADPFLIAFVGALANTSVPLLTANFSGLTVPSMYSQTDAGVSLLSSPESGLNQQQVVGYASTSGNPVTQGDFELTFEGQTATLPYNATPDAVQTALEGLSTIGAGNVIVTGPGTPNDGTTGSAYYTITFTGVFSGDAVLPAVTIQAGTLADSQGGAVSVQSWIVTSPPEPKGEVPQAAVMAAPEPQGEVQQVVVTAASGTVSLSFEGETTAAIDLPATAASVRTALENLPLIGTGNVQVTGSGTWASPFLVVFVGVMAGQALPALTEADSLSTVNTVTTTYNTDSQIATIGDNYSHYAYTYDGQGNTASVDNSGTPGVPDVVLASQYDGMGNRTSLSATIGGVKDFVNNYSYDALSRLYDVVQQNQSGGNAVAPKQVYYKLDGIGDVTEIDRSTSVTLGPNPSGFADSVLTYKSNTGQLIGINHESRGASVDDLTYAYDGVGRVQTFTTNDGQATYGYDPMSQLTSATYTAAQGHTEPPNLSLSFDTNGNRTSVDGTGTTVAPDNHLANDGTFTFGYDAAGNLITRTRISGAPANDYQVNYTWDTANRLVDVQDLNKSLALTEQINYTYDVYGRLIERVDDVIGGSTTTVDYVWDSPLPLGEGQGEGGMVLAFDGNQNLTARYLNGPNTSAYDQFYTTLAQEDVSSPSQQGTVTWPLPDAQGSVIDVTDASGTVIDHIEYNATGAVFSESNPSVSHVASFQGGYLDPATGMVKYGLRWEVMADAFWASEDPIGFLSGTANLTEAVGNDPANAIDPTGLEEMLLVHATRPEAVSPIVKQGLRGGRDGLIWTATQNAAGSGASAECTAHLHYKVDVTSVREIPTSVLKAGEKIANTAAKGLTGAARSLAWAQAKYQYVASWINAQPEGVFRMRNPGQGKVGFHFAFKPAAWNAAKPALKQLTGAGAKAAVGCLATEAGAADGLSAAAASKWGSRIKLAGRVGGRGVVVVGVGVSIYEVYTAEDRPREITKHVGGWAGAIGGGFLGAKGGAAVGTLGGPIGTVAGGVVGGIGGGAAGFLLGSKVTETVYDWTFKPGAAVPAAE